MARIESDDDWFVKLQYARFTEKHRKRTKKDKNYDEVIYAYSLAHKNDTTFPAWAHKKMCEFCHDYVSNTMKGKSPLYDFYDMFGIKKQKPKRTFRTVLKIAILPCYEILLNCEDENTAKNYTKEKVYELLGEHLRDIPRCPGSKDKIDKKFIKQLATNIGESDSGSLNSMVKSRKNIPENYNESFYKDIEAIEKTGVDLYISCYVSSTIDMAFKMYGSSIWAR